MNTNRRSYSKSGINLPSCVGIIFLLIIFSFPVDAQVSQCIISGTVRIDGAVIPSVKSAKIRALKKNYSFIRQADYNSQSGNYGVNLFSSDGLLNGDMVYFQLITNQDTIIARTSGKPPIFFGTVLPNPPDTNSLLTVNLFNNNTPIITSSPDAIAREDSLYSYVLQAADRDGDPLIYSAIVLPRWLTFNPTTKILSGIPKASNVGDTLVKLQVNDSFFRGIATQTFALKVLHTNHAPVFVKVLPDTAINENQSLSFAYQAGDADGDILTFSVVSPPAKLTVSTSGLVQWTPDYSQAGVYKLIISVTDGKLSVSDTAAITVKNVNQSPVFTKVLPDTTIFENQSLTFTYTGIDPDGDSIFFKKETTANWTISAKGDFAWTPAYSDSGKHAIMVGLSDGQVAVFHTAVVIVQNVNRLPIFTKVLPDTTIKENQLIEFSYQGDDPDGNGLTFNKVSGPSGLIVSSNGNLSWTPSFTDAGTHRVIVAVSDGYDAVKDTANIIVENVNRPPIFIKILSDTAINRKQTLSFKYEGNDPDGDSITFTKIGASPAGLSISPKGDLLWTPDSLQGGVYAIGAGLSDGGLMVYDTAQVKVNRPPSAVKLVSPVNDFLIKNKTMTFRWTKSVDPDADSVSYKMIIFQKDSAAPNAIIVLKDTATTKLFDFLVVKKEYRWTVIADDKMTTTASPDTFTFRTSDTLTIINGGKIEMVKDYVLFQNYPNPFNPSTIIRYAVPVRSYIRLEIFSTLGQKLGTLAEGEVNAGVYTAHWRTSSASSLYFYRIEAIALDDPDKKFLEVKKMLFLK